MTIRIPYWTLLLLLCSGLLFGQISGERMIGTSVTYISGASLYLGAGRTQSLALGETGLVVRRTPVPVRVVIGAVSSGSSLARLLNPADSVAVGDS